MAGPPTKAAAQSQEKTYDVGAAAAMLAALKPLDSARRLATLAVVCKVVIEDRLPYEDQR